MLKIQYLNITDSITEYEIPAANRIVPEDQILPILLDIRKEWLKTHSVYEYFPLKQLLTVEWSWEDSSKRTLPQRIASILKQHGAVLPKSFLGALGNHVKETIPISKPSLIDITQDFDWKKGDFQDSGSCFWQGRREVKNAMEKDKRFYAFRIYDYEHHRGERGIQNMLRPFLGGRPPILPRGTYNKKPIYGYARCWLFETTVKIKLHGKMTKSLVYLAFNAYGLTMKQIAPILGTKARCAYQPIKLSNKGKVHGGLYFNSNSYVFGDPLVIRNMHHYNFNFDNSYDSKTRGTIPNGIQERRLRWQEGMQYQYDVRNRRNRRWTEKPDRKKEKTKNRKNPIQGDLLQTVHHHNRDLMHDLIDWMDFAKWEIPNPATQRFYWRLLYHRTRGAFFSVLIKLINHKITRGYNEKASNKK